jgi:mono/diheme cytochrome c family protein
MRTQFFILVGTMLMSAPAIAQTAASDLGRQEYMGHCAVCHGVAGKGDGPMAGYGYQKVADLTTIAKRNNGVFPFSRVYEVIDGREAIKGHGTREMPIWGNSYTQEGAGMMGVWVTSKDLQSYTRGRIIALIGYIGSLQEK